MSDKKQEKNQESPFSPEQEEQAPRQVHDRFLRASLKYVPSDNEDFNTVCQEKIIPAMKELFERIPHEFDQLLSQFVNYIFKSCQLPDPEKFAKIMGEIDEKVEDKVLTLEQSIRQQGRVEERRELTLRMLRNGVDLETVAKVTEQQPEEIDRISIKWKKEAIA